MIPKIIHYCWFGGEKPELVQRCICSWKKYCPDYQILEWNEENFDLSSSMFSKEAFIHKKYALLSDYIRLSAMVEYGGIYLDTDVELVRSLDGLLIHAVFMAAEDDFYIATGLGMGAEPGHPYMKAMLNMYQGIHCCGSDGTLICKPSPVYFTNELIRNGYRHMGNKIRKINDITIFPKEYFSPSSFWEPTPMITTNTYAWHHGMASWIPPLLKQEREAYIASSKAVFVSPHFDDAVGSCAGWINRLKQDGISVEILTVMSDGIPIRQKEDECACDKLGVSRRIMGIKECISRTGNNGELLYPNIGDEFMLVSNEEHDLQERILRYMEEYDKERVHFYFPVGIGHHVDHIIMYNVGTILHLKGWNVTFYADFSYEGPYPLNMKELVYPLTEKQQEIKREAIESYVSQLSRLFDSRGGWSEYSKSFLQTEKYYIFLSAD